MSSVCRNPRVEEEIRYARNGGVAIAYQVVGEGDTDLVYVPAYMSNLVYGWEFPRWRSFYESLARSFRLILFDKRGTGLSDHGGQFAALETRMEDLRAVLDAAGARPNAVLLGANEGCAMAALFAATYPERTRALVLFHPYSSGHRGRGSREGSSGSARFVSAGARSEFSDKLLREGCPPLYESEEHRRRFANGQRVGASVRPSPTPSTARTCETDLRDVLPAVRVPALVLYLAHAREEQALDVAGGIPSARAVRIPGEGWFGIASVTRGGRRAGALRRRRGRAANSRERARRLMFTDIVGSTERAAELGDRAWRDLLAQHNALCDESSRAFAARSATPPETASSRPSTAPRGRFAPAQAILPACARSASKPASASTSASASSTRASWRESPSASGRESRLRWRGRGARLVHRPRPRRGLGSTFEPRGERELKGIPGIWQVYAANRASMGSSSLAASGAWGGRAPACASVRECHMKSRKEGLTERG